MWYRNYLVGWMVGDVGNCVPASETSSCVFHDSDVHAASRVGCPSSGVPGASLLPGFTLDSCSFGPGRFLTLPVALTALRWASPFPCRHHAAGRLH